MSKEIWREVPEYEGRYEASNFGRVRSARSGQVLKPHYFKCKYATYNFYGSAGKARCMRGYRAVYTAFNGPIPCGFEIDHIDNDTKNDRLDNLQLLTRQENMAKSWRLRRTTGYQARNAHSKTRGAA